MTPTSISAAQARRIALGAQGFTSRVPATPAAAALRRTVAHTHLIQMDSVNIAVRAHYLPMFSRMGPYDRSILDRAAWRRGRPGTRLLTEYWAHEAALIPVDDWPLFGWRMREFADGRYRHTREIMRRNASLADNVRAVIVERGASMPRDIEAHLGIDRGAGRAGSWWERGEVKHICEALFASGEFAAVRDDKFSRFYDLAENVVGADARDVAEATDAATAWRELVKRASRALGVATAADLADYYRLSRAQTQPAIDDLVDASEISRVAVVGWKDPAYLATGAKLPRTVTRSAILSPFDPLVFYRPRAHRLFDFHYRIEIYVPEPKRVHGYYVHPYLMGADIVARVDLKADRAAGILRVPAAYLEPDHDQSAVAQSLAADLWQLAGWLGLDDVIVARRGDLTTALRTATYALR